MKKSIIKLLSVVVLMFALNITVKSNVTAVIGYSNTTVCYGSSINFVDSSRVTSGYIVSWTWSFGPNAAPTMSTLQNPGAVVFNFGGQTDVSLVVVDNFGNQSSSWITIYSSSQPNPQVTPWNTAPLCAGDSIQLNASYAAHYQWFENNTPIIGANSNSIWVNQTAQYKVQVTDANGCTGQSGVNWITVNSPLNLTVTANFNAPQPVNPIVANAGGYIRLCPGAEIYFYVNNTNNNVNGGLNYNWSDGSTFGPQRTVDSVGDYAVTITNSSGCTATLPAIHVVHANAPSNVVLNSPADSIFCGYNNQIMVSTPAFYVGYAWDWDNSNNNNWYGNSTSFQVNGTGSISVSVVDSNGCVGTSPTRNFTFTYPLPTPSVFVSTNAPCQLATNPAPMIQWVNQAGDMLGETSQYLTVTSPGWYSAKIKSLDSNDCWSVSNPVYANCLSSGIVEIGEPKNILSFSENPTHGIVSVNLPPSNETEINFYSADGRNVKTIKGKGFITIDLTDLSQGIYFTKIRSGDIIIKTDKLVMIK